MQRQDFHYSLPEPLIARYPAEQRRGSRLLCLDGPSGSVRHKQFPDLLDALQPGDLLVLNDTRVIPARLFGRKASGGQVEVLVERVVSKSSVLAHTRASKSPKAGAELILEDGTVLKVIGRQGALFELEFPEDVLQVLDRLGHMPLPPYIEREDNDFDKERYQTVYGKHKGAVAAPTAGLHFDDELFAALKSKGIDTAFVTLHVGAGTFQPVRVDNITEHEMHSEVMSISAEVCKKVLATKKAGGRVVAVGTTSVRCLETAALRSGSSELLTPYTGETDIFIYPGRSFNVVDVLITNFHLPESTLIMLVSAFAGFKHTMNAYAVAVKEKYRFFSYGDAMLITKNPKAEKL